MYYSKELLEYIKKERPEIYDKMVAESEKYDSKQPYTPTNDEKEIIKEVLHMNDDWFNTMEVYIFNDGELCVTTPDIAWDNLCGREWWVNLKEKKAILKAMN